MMKSDVNGRLREVTRKLCECAICDHADRDAALSLLAHVRMLCSSSNGTNVNVTESELALLELRVHQIERRVAFGSEEIVTDITGAFIEQASAQGKGIQSLGKLLLTPDLRKRYIDQYIVDLRNEYLEAKLAERHAFACWIVIRTHVRILWPLVFSLWRLLAGIIIKIFA